MNHIQEATPGTVRVYARILGKSESSQSTVQGSDGSTVQSIRLPAKETGALLVPLQGHRSDVCLELQPILQYPVHKRANVHGHEGDASTRRVRYINKARKEDTKAAITTDETGITTGCRGGTIVRKLKQDNGSDFRDRRSSRKQTFWVYQRQLGHSAQDRPDEVWIHLLALKPASCLNRGISLRSSQSEVAAKCLLGATVIDVPPSLSTLSS
ncbi:hypothetical protein V5799_007402 [Amblyomma americanum]|uniref:Uncharacterized protein n=1 Tax=Amblyomma americanum TaxID=6943 RepID=A0AAQ4FHH7_AMBAM